jgi:hypothetical protein
MWHALCIECMKLIVKYIFLADILFLEGRLRLGCIQFPLERGGGAGVILD